MQWKLGGQRSTSTLLFKSVGTPNVCQVTTIVVQTHLNTSVGSKEWVEEEYPIVAYYFFWSFLKSCRLSNKYTTKVCVVSVFQFKSRKAHSLLRDTFFLLR